jgi:hypothetical protein
MTYSSFLLALLDAQLLGVLVGVRYPRRASAFITTADNRASVLSMRQVRFTHALVVLVPRVALVMDPFQTHPTPHALIDYGQRPEGHLPGLVQANPPHFLGDRPVVLRCSH